MKRIFTLIACPLSTMLAVTFALATAAPAQHAYPELKFLPDEQTRLWKITPDYPDPNPPPLRVKLNDLAILEYTILSGYQTNFRSGPKILDIIAKQLDEKNNKLNLAWLVHDINYEGYLRDRKTADELLFSMLLDAGLSDIRAGAIYYGVRFFGKGHYCDMSKPDRPCAKNPLIRFSQREAPTFGASLEAVKKLPAHDMQPMRLLLMTATRKDEVKREIQDIFPGDAASVIKELDEEGRN